MDGMLSQEEINALLSGGGDEDNAGDGQTEGLLTDIERDAVGEIANISMGTAATTLFSLVNQKVVITTPNVSYATWDDIVDAHEKPCVFIRIAYTVGLDGSNVLILRENDVKVITDLMMGGDGTNLEGELGELHLSAISEAMNQMMGSSATSLSSMLNQKIDISPPKATLVDLHETVDEAEIAEFLSETFVRISFKLEIGELIDSEIMQLYPITFAKDMYESYMNNMMNGTAGGEEPQGDPQPAPAPAPEPAPAPAPMPAQAAPQGMPQMMPDPNMMQQPYMQPYPGQPYMQQPYMAAPVNVQQAQFQPFTADLSAITQKENIDLIIDVPLEVTVELGRTTKSIQEILDFAPGTIIELNRVAGEPIDVLVNGKYVAKGEVVVIEESFGIRITEIIK